MPTAKMLYVDLNAHFINPTRNFLPLVIGMGGACLFGPGYVSPETLSRGLREFVRREGPFEVAVSNTLVLFSGIYGLANNDIAFRRSYSSALTANDLSVVEDIAREFGALKIPRVAVLLESDFYNWKAREIETIRASADYVIGFGPQFSPRLADMRDLGCESFALHATDVWANYVHEQPASVASFLHFVSDAEFDWTSLALRPNSWSVMGVQYDARARARSALEKGGILPVIDTKLRKALSAAKRLKLVRDETRAMQLWLNYDFRRRLSQTRYAYTCGSGLDMPIRKFFEIPAAGAVLVCKPFAGFEAAGFRHGENCVVCEPDDILDAHQWLESDPERAQRIADAGRALVLSRHSTVARTRQLRDTLQAIADGSFAGGEWANGEYVVKRHGGKTASRSE